MEKVKKLYPMKFQPIIAEKSWGTESLWIADLGAEDSEVSEGWLGGSTIGDIMETYLERVTGDSVYEYYGRQFPIAVKCVEINGETPVYVHPDDEIAEQRYDALGGKELWYIAEEGEGSGIYLGFSKDTSAQEVYSRCLEGSVKEIMNLIHPKKGDFLAVEPGSVHSAYGKGLRIIVVKESSELPFRLYDKGEDSSELAGTHLAEAMDFINYRKYAAPGKTEGTDGKRGESRRGHSQDEVTEKITECPEFSVTRIRLSDPLHIYTEQFGSFIILICVTGEASVQVQETDSTGKKNLGNYFLKKGEVMLIPAEMQDFFIVPVDRSTVLIEATAGRRDTADSYINPDTEPFLEGEDYEGIEDETEDKRQ